MLLGRTFTGPTTTTPGCKNSDRYWGQYNQRPQQASGPLQGSLDPIPEHQLQVSRHPPEYRASFHQPHLPALLRTHSNPGSLVAVRRAVGSSVHVGFPKARRRTPPLSTRDVVLPPFVPLSFSVCWGRTFSSYQWHFVSFRSRISALSAILGKRLLGCRIDQRLVRNW